MKVKVLLALAIILVASQVRARIPEPDNLLYGTVTIGATPMTAANSDILITAVHGGTVVASYAMGADPGLGNQYALALSMESVTPRELGRLQVGDAVGIYVMNILAAAVQVQPRGAVTQLNLLVTSLDSDGDGMDDWFETLYGLSDPQADKDGDGLTNLQEFQIGTRPDQNDTDHDGIDDLYEYTYSSVCGLSPFDGNTAADHDADGVRDREERTAGTNPCIDDTDADGMDDGWEIAYASCGVAPLAADTLADADADGLKNLEEYNLATDPCDHDTDGDGLEDGPEIHTALSNPLAPDTDGDAMTDGWEFTYPCVEVLAPDPAGDPDGDGLSNLQEFGYSTHPCAVDVDGDGLGDFEEILNGTDPAKADTDDDGLNDGAEINVYFTDSKNPDSDGDLIPDGWEISNGFNPLSPADAGGDPDGDGVDNLAEYQNRANPYSSDSDGDGLPDPWEIANHTDPDQYDRNDDIDDDLLTNYQEYQTGTNPSLTDTDGDGVADGEEFFTGADGYVTDPREEDTDHDGLTDGQEILIYHTDPTSSDTDGDLIPDGWEISNGLDPRGDDSARDSDQDGLSDPQEYLHNTNRNNPDTDLDGMPDGWEVVSGLDPLSKDATADPDADGLTNLQEYANKTNPLHSDTDQDGLTDCEEVFAGADGFVTDPTRSDTDGDRIPDGWEVNQGLNPDDTSDGLADPDHDGLSSLIEYLDDTDPRLDNNAMTDTDYDRMPDLYEIAHGLNANAPDHFADPDHDGLPNYLEYLNGTDPQVPNDLLLDEDGDSMFDLWEVAFGLDPGTDDSRQDLDDDARNNLNEYYNGTRPDLDNRLPANYPDLNQNGIPDLWEHGHGLGQYDYDTDWDHFANLIEYYNGTDPQVGNTAQPDSDQDGLPDRWEIMVGADPQRYDSNEDPDDDGLNNWAEYAAGADPFFDNRGYTDADRDGLPDDYETAWMIDLPNSDHEGDQLTNREEYFAGLNPTRNQFTPLIAVTPERVTINLGEIVNFTVSGADAPVIWAATEPGLGSFGPDGMFTAQKAGTAVIVAIDGNLNAARAELKVNSAPADQGGKVTNHYDETTNNGCGSCTLYPADQRPGAMALNGLIWALPLVMALGSRLRRRPNPK